jgi:hypothetical protein
MIKLIFYSTSKADFIAEIINKSITDIASSKINMGMIQNFPQKLFVISEELGNKISIS